MSTLDDELKLKLPWELYSKMKNQISVESTFKDIHDVLRLHDEIHEAIVETDWYKERFDKQMEEMKKRNPKSKK